MREIKFRMYYKDKLIEELTLEEIADKCEFHWDPERVKVCQYTGLKDKNGKEIYEGDIFVVPSLPWRHLVEWEHGCWMATQINNSRRSRPDVRSLFSAGSIYEVIGNIYENGDLIDPD